MHLRPPAYDDRATEGGVRGVGKRRSRRRPSAGDRHRQVVALRRHRGACRRVRHRSVGGRGRGVAAVDRAGFVGVDRRCRHRMDADGGRGRRLATGASQRSRSAVGRELGSRGSSTTWTPRAGPSCNGSPTMACPCTGARCCRRWSAIRRAGPRRDLSVSRRRWPTPPRSSRSSGAIKPLRSCSRCCSSRSPPGGSPNAIARERRSRRTAMRLAALLGAVVIVDAAARASFPGLTTEHLVVLGYETVLCVVAVGLAHGLLPRPWDQGDVTDLVVDLGTQRPGSFRDALSQALGDPGLQVGYWAPAPGSSSMPMAGRWRRRPSGPDRSATVIDGGREPVAVLLHDRALLDDPALVSAVGAADALGGRQCPTAGRGARPTGRDRGVPPALGHRRRRRASTAGAPAPIRRGAASQGAGGTARRGTPVRRRAGRGRPRRSRSAAEVDARGGAGVGCRTASSIADRGRSAWRARGVGRPMPDARAGDCRRGPAPRADQRGDLLRVLGGPRQRGETRRRRRRRSSRSRSGRTT